MFAAKQSDILSVPPVTAALMRTPKDAQVTSNRMSSESHVAYEHDYPPYRILKIRQLTLRNSCIDVATIHRRKMEQWCVLERCDADSYRLHISAVSKTFTDAKPPRTACFCFSSFLDHPPLSISCIAAAMSSVQAAGNRTLGSYESRADDWPMPATH